MNMSYCRFRNTYRDFCDCFNALSDNGLADLSEDEFRYADKMRTLCEEFIERYDEELGYYIESHIEDK